MYKNITLQINISPGDINYALLTVPELVKKHKSITNRLLVVDCCRPQRTKIVNPDKKFPIEEFTKKVSKIKEIALQLKTQCEFTEVFFLEPDSQIIKLLSKKYLNNIYKCTHAGGGTANMSYWAALEIPNTKYVLHLDGDMIMYQNSNFEWYTEAIKILENETDAIMAVPRLCPPVINNFELPSSNEGRVFENKENYWINDWFSTRHFLLDKEKLSSFLPLVTGKIKYETLLRRWLKRVYPFDPEIVLFKKLSPQGCKRVILKNTNAWFLHPANKPQEFINIIEKIIDEVNVGNYPLEQAGDENIDIKAWQKYLNNK
jgi:hypothetical protein